jgi:hypothetical protein
MRKIVLLAIALTLIASGCGGGSTKPAARGSGKSSGGRYSYRDSYHGGAAVITLQLLPAGTRNPVVAKLEACRREGHPKRFFYALATIDDRNGKDLEQIFTYKIVTTSGRTIILKMAANHFGRWFGYSIQTNKNHAVYDRCGFKLYDSIFAKDAASPGERVVGLFTAPVRTPAIRYVIARIAAKTEYGHVQPRQMKRIG